MMPYCSHMEALLAETAPKRNSMSQRRRYSLVSHFGISCDPLSWKPTGMVPPRGPGIHLREASPGEASSKGLDHDHASRQGSGLPRFPLTEMFWGIVSLHKQSGGCPERLERDASLDVRDAREVCTAAATVNSQLVAHVTLISCDVPRLWRPLPG